MLANRVLPPILRPPSPPLPVATFINIPRRYVRSNMQIDDDPSRSSNEDANSVRNLRKNSRLHDGQTGSTSSPVHRTKEEPSPTSSPPRALRKQVLSFENEVNGGGPVEENSPMDPMAPPSASSVGSGDFGHVCLCQSEPKIPRPRNAFILYRQHHQHTIVARNPGLANPDISKIIGEQWQAESEEQKKVWQDLAQEEKARHHEQYPDYRYQPRRTLKPLDPAVQHTTIDKYRCSRCGGRSIKTPTSPFPSSAGTPTLPLPNVSEGLTPTTRYLPMMSNLSLDSPARRHGPGPSSLSQLQVPSSAREDATMYSPMTPDLKRRRVNYPANPNNGRRTDGPYYTQARRESLPPIQVRQSPPNSATMPPPRTPRDMRRGSVDLSLLVPNPHDQSRSVEAMVMSVPYHVKIKVLGRITPPLKPPGPTSPAMQVRGAIIAIEGDDTPAIQELAAWLHDFLAKDKECHPRVFEPPKAPKDDAKDVSFEDYLGLIQKWHSKSDDMIKYITTPFVPAPSDSTTSTTTDSSDQPTKPKTQAPSSPSPDLSTKPVIILPTYQLRASDAYTSRIPIQDAYSPTDHWQWIATLWRGTVGPDLTLYVKSFDAQDGLGSAKLVELDDGVRCLTVMRERGGRFEESALRRVGFEVGEWVRGVGVGMGVAGRKGSS
ncbi:hypothetical protein BDV95DRAFT_593593 [Massariosphaeria phaeospora]|uniref:HMG box domain-containing protein n=1 Tax=Massariosphaeria phaeospora TaxID=100035 RepID=A0A7C8I8C8_9PLEO|nr:hypothetical protein BDV95DRAFT_593593 [Massariosphaeria phaeospora]